MADNDWLNQIGSILAINKVFTVLVLVIIICGVVLYAAVPNLDGNWGDARLWVVIFVLSIIVAIVIIILRLMKTDPARLLEPKVADTTFQDSEALSSDELTSGEES